MSGRRPQPAHAAGGDVRHDAGADPGRERRLPADHRPAGPSACASRPAARQFAVLATPALGQSFDSYFNSGYFKFRQFVLDLLARSDEVTAILVCDVEGRVLFDSRADRRTRRRSTPWPRSTASGSGVAARRAQRDPAGGRGRRAFEIVVPYVEDWGRHRLSAVYHVSLAGLEGQFRRSVRRALELVAVSGVLAALLGLVLGTRLTRPLAALTEGVQQVARGNYEKRLHVESGDELQVVAEAFNDMSSRLQHTIGEMERRNAELERFTYTVSHDLRSPLVTVLGFLGLLERDIEAGAQGERARGRRAHPLRGGEDGEAAARAARAVARGARHHHARGRAAAGAGRGGAPGARGPAGRGRGRAAARRRPAGALRGPRAAAGGGAEPRGQRGQVHGQERAPADPDRRAARAHGTVCFVRDNGIGIDPKHHQLSSACSSGSIRGSRAPASASRS